MQVSGWYSDGEGKNKEPVAIQLDTDKCQIQLVGIKRRFSVRWPVDDVYIAGKKPTSNGVIRIRHERYRKESLHLTSTKFVSDLKAFEPTVEQSPFMRNRRVKLAAFSSCVLFSIALFVVLSNNALSTIAVSKSTHSWQHSVSEQVISAFAEGKQICTADEGSKTLQNIANRMAANSQFSQSFNVTVIKSEVPRMFALPGGDIVVTSAQLADERYIDSMIYSLAVQMAHIESGHVLDTVVQRADFPQLMLSMLTGESSMVIKDRLKDFVDPQYAPTARRIAGERAAEIVHSAGFFFEKNSVKNNNVQSFTSVTHQRQLTTPAYPLSENHWHSIKETCQ